MPGDSAIEELNLRLGACEGQGRGSRERLPGDRGRLSSPAPRPESTSSRRSQNEIRRRGKPNNP